MATWTLSLTPGSEAPEMTAAWVGGTPNRSTPAHVGDSLVIKFPFPAIANTKQTSIMLNLSWDKHNKHDAVVAFNGAPDTEEAGMVRWGTSILHAPADKKAYVFRAYVVVHTVGDDPIIYEVDPEMVIKPGG